jgi:phage protein U
LTFPLEVCSEFGNFVITLIENLETTFAKMVKSVKRTHSIELQRETKKQKLAKKKNSKTSTCFKILVFSTLIILLILACNFSLCLFFR